MASTSARSEIGPQGTASPGAHRYAEQVVALLAIVRILSCGRWHSGVDRRYEATQDITPLAGSKPRCQQAIVNLSGYRETNESRSGKVQTCVGEPVRLAIHIGLLERNHTIAVLVHQ